MMIFLGSDHGGYNLKEQLKKYLIRKGHRVMDCGAHRHDPGDDYPDFAIPVARAVGSHKSARGILLCRSGAGVNIVANRFPGNFAVLTDNAKLLTMVRQHEDVNILCLASDFITLQTAKRLVDIFLSIPFSGAARHQRRMRKIDRIRV